MAHHDVWTCDAAGCRKPAPFHLDLAVGEEVIDQGAETEHVAVQRRRADLCPDHVGRLLDYLTDGLSYGATQALLDFAITPAPARVKEPV
jgi:hypothetical protein